MYPLWHTEKGQIMVAVVHRTPGLIPVEAFTVAGLSAKPNSTNPIGKFGTGLKYAIAVLVRMDIKVTLFIGQTEYVFYKKKRQFRGKDYFAIRMKKRQGLLGKWSYHEMPFTTEYGKYWELWQVFRELHANTLDEGGETFQTTDASTFPEAEQTLFIIEDSRYVDVYHERDRIFLPGGLKARNNSDSIEVIGRPSKHIYFRGLRVMDLKKEAQFTYNFLENVDLTEDRTVKYPHMIEGRIVGMMQESKDNVFLDKVVARPKEGSYERGLHHGHAYSTGWSAPSVSAIYMAAAKDSPISTAKEVWNQQQPTVPSDISIHIKIPKPSISDYEISLLKDAVELIHRDSRIAIDGVDLVEEEEDKVTF